ISRSARRPVRSISFAISIPCLHKKASPPQLWDGKARGTTQFTLPKESLFAPLTPGYAGTPRPRAPRSARRKPAGAACLSPAWRLAPAAASLSGGKKTSSPRVLSMTALIISLRRPCVNHREGKKIPRSPEKNRGEWLREPLPQGLGQGVEHLGGDAPV